MSKQTLLQISTAISGDNVVLQSYIQIEQKHLSKTGSEKHCVLDLGPPYRVHIIDSIRVNL